VSKNTSDFYNSFGFFVSSFALFNPEKIKRWIFTAYYWALKKTVLHLIKFYAWKNDLLEVLWTLPSTLCRGASMTSRLHIQTLPVNQVPALL
jgi:hypothetical protein